MRTEFGRWNAKKSRDIHSDSEIYIFFFPRHTALLILSTIVISFSSENLWQGKMFEELEANSPLSVGLFKYKTFMRIFWTVKHRWLCGALISVRHDFMLQHRPAECSQSAMCKTFRSHALTHCFRCQHSPSEWTLQPCQRSHLSSSSTHAGWMGVKLSFLADGLFQRKVDFQT